MVVGSYAATHAAGRVKTTISRPAAFNPRQSQSYRDSSEKSIAVNLRKSDAKQGKHP
jgi:hypothetical protein